MIFVVTPENSSEVSRRSRTYDAASYLSMTTYFEAPCGGCCRARISACDFKRAPPAPVLRASVVRVCHPREPRRAARGRCRATDGPPESGACRTFTLRHPPAAIRRRGWTGRTASAMPTACSACSACSTARQIPYGAHVGLWMAPDEILHLCREVGVPPCGPWRSSRDAPGMRRPSASSASKARAEYRAPAGGRSCP
jgi:hypothetical protein